MRNASAVAGAASSGRPQRGHKNNQPSAASPALPSSHTHTHTTMHVRAWPDLPPVLNRDADDVPVMSLFCDDDDEELLSLLHTGGFPFPLDGAFSSSPFRDELDLVQKKVLNQPPPPPRGLKGLAFAAGVSSSAILSVDFLIAAVSARDSRGLDCGPRAPPTFGTTALAPVNVCMCGCVRKTDSTQNETYQPARPNISGQEPCSPVCFAAESTALRATSI